MKKMKSWATWLLVVLAIALPANLSRAAVDDITAVINADGWSANVTWVGRSAAFAGGTKLDFGTWRLPGTLNGTFTDGETVTQAGSGCTAVVSGASQGAGNTYLVVKHMTVFELSTGTGTWTGATSGFTLIPSDRGDGHVTPYHMGDSKLSFVVTSEGYNAAGVLGTTTRTVYASALVKMPVDATAFDTQSLPGSVTAGTFTHEELATGGTSGATYNVYCPVTGIVSGHTYLFGHTRTGTPTAGGETFTGGTSGATFATTAGGTTRTVDERVVGSDLVFRVALSEEVYNDDKNGGAGTSGTNPVMTASAGFCTQGGNSSTAMSSVSCTNNSTLDYPICIAQWDPIAGELTYSRVTAATYILAVDAGHGFGIACVRINAVGGTSLVDTESYVTTRTSTASTVTGLRRDSYQMTVTQAAYTQGETITGRFRVYPKVGDADSVLDTNGRSTTTLEVLGWNDHVVICDKTGALASVKYVATTGSDSGAGTEGDPYATIAKAVSVAGVTTVYLLVEGSTHLLGSTLTRRANGSWVLVTRAPGLTTVYVTMPGSNRSTRCDRLMLQDLTIRPANTTSYLDGEALNNSLALRRIVWDRNGVGNQTSAPISYRTDVTYFLEQSGEFSMAKFGFGLFSTQRGGGVYDGCAIEAADTTNNGSYRVVRCSSTGFVGFKCKTTANPAPTQNNFIFGSNKFIDCTTASGGWIVEYATQEQQLNSWFDQNIIEKTSGGGGGIFLLSSSGFAGDNTLVTGNTIIGEASYGKCNMWYNDSGVVGVYHKRIFVQNNSIQSPHIKGDEFGTNSAFRIGNFPQRYAVNQKNNNFGDMEIDADPYYHGGIGTTRDAPTFVNAGTNDFTPASGSILLNRITSLFSTRDQAGYYLSTDATALASVGALQPTPTITATVNGSSVLDGGTAALGNQPAGSSVNVIIGNGGLTGSVLYMSAIATGGGLTSSSAGPLTVVSGGINSNPTYTLTVDGTNSGTNTITSNGGDGSFLINATWTAANRKRRTHDSTTEGRPPPPPPMSMVVPAGPGLVRPRKRAA